MGKVTTNYPTKPKALRILHGDDKNRINQNEPEMQALTGVLNPTIKLNEYGLETFNKLVPQLIAARVLTEADINGFSAYCHEWGMYKHCRDVIEKEGLVITAGKNDYPMPHPLTTVANKHFKNAYDMMLQYGLTPSSRTRINALPEKKKDGISSLKKEPKTA